MTAADFIAEITSFVRTRRRDRIPGRRPRNSGEPKIAHSSSSEPSSTISPSITARTRSPIAMSASSSSTACSPTMTAAAARSAPSAWESCCRATRKPSGVAGTGYTTKRCSTESSRRGLAIDTGRSSTVFC
jgi:hypothetical protein